MLNQNIMESLPVLLVGEDDTACQNLEQIKDLFEKQTEVLKKTIEKGKPMEKIK